MTCAFSHWPRHTYVLDEYFTGRYVHVNTVNRSKHANSTMHEKRLRVQHGPDRSMRGTWNKLAIQSLLRMISDSEMGSISIMLSEKCSF